MNIAGFHFPHPILGKPGDYQVSPLTMTNYNFIDKSDSHRFEFSSELNDDYLLDLLGKKQIEMVCEVNCTHTFYRRIFKSFSTKLAFEIPYNDLRKKVELQLFLIANERVDQFKSPNISKKFSDQSFIVEKGDLLGILEQQVLNVDMGSGQVSDIIMVTQHEEDEYHGVRYFLNNDYIQVKLHQNQFELLKTIHNNPEFSDIIISSLLIPAFSFACAHINEDDENKYGERKWFETLKEKALDLCGTEYLDKNSTPEFIDKLLQFPNPRLLKSMVTLQNIDYV